MTIWFAVFGLIYLGLLGFASYKSFSKNRSADEFMLANSQVGAFLGFMTFAAALFSAFTFMGMPDMFRKQGVGAWIFLALADGAMAFFILWFGRLIRKRSKEVGFKGVSGMVGTLFGNRWAGYLFFAGSFIFLVPYAAIQIKGIAIFFSATFPNALPSWGWSAAIVAVMLIYSVLGGLKAIIFSDAVQAILLLVIIWIIGFTCIAHFGSTTQLFEEVERLKPELLTTPGPNGLFSVQFLLASLISIVMIPVTQPQMTTRLVVMKNYKAVQTMAIALSVFAAVIIAPTIFIGMYGAVRYPELPTNQYLAQALLFDQHASVAALSLVGLIAACLSTTNAQIFALGSELRSLLQGDEKSVMNKVRISLAAFAVFTLIFSVVSSDALAMLALASFKGTSMMAPLVLVGLLSKRKPGVEIIVASGIGILLMLCSLGGLLPSHILGLFTDLWIYAALIVVSLGSYIARR